MAPLWVFLGVLLAVAGGEPTSGHKGYIASCRGYCRNQSQVTVTKLVKQEQQTVTHYKGTVSTKTVVVQVTKLASVTHLKQQTSTVTLLQIKSAHGQTVTKTLVTMKTVCPGTTW